jgi:ribose transport system permease protein
MTVSPPPTETAAIESPLARPSLWRRLPQWLAPLAALVLLVAITSIANPTFVQPGNIINILHNSSFVGLLAIGMTFVIIAGGIDLSVASLMVLAGGLGIWVMNTCIDADGILKAVDAAQKARTAAPYSAMRMWLAQGFSAGAMGGGELAGVIVGGATTVLAATLGGLLNGLLVTKGRVAPFIATLGGLAAYRSLAQAIVDGGEFRSASSSVFAQLGAGGVPIGFSAFGERFFYNHYGNPLILPWPVLIFPLVALAAWVLLARTRFGRYVYAIGCNERAAEYSAIRVDRVRLKTYVLMGLLTGLAALLAASRMNSVGSGNTALFWELDAIAAVVIGGTRMSGGVGTLGGTIIGLLILGVLNSMTNFLQVSTHLQNAVKGAVIVAAALLQRPRRT